MKLIHEFAPPKCLKHWHFDFNDSKEFIERFEISEEVSKVLCEYLKKTEQIVNVCEQYDPQSGWRGYSFTIGGTDLSLNGFCFSEKRLVDYLSKTST